MAHMAPKKYDDWLAQVHMGNAEQPVEHRIMRIKLLAAKMAGGEE
ncbi:MULTISPECIES: hypothetical protein [unclassified Bradyrhizobium]|nr:MULTISPECIES: hypothetical protein [unclassified Bradyrhizobium]